MPQMAPMYWLILFFYFIVLLIFYVVVLYFSFNPNTAQTTAGSSTSVNPLNWLW